MRKSIENQKSDEEFTCLFFASHTEGEFAYSLGIFNYGGETFRLLKKRCEKLGLDRKKQWPGAHKAPGEHFFLSDEEYFSLGSARTGKSTRARLLREKLLLYRCAGCGNDGHWRGKRLRLEVDHINGDHFDNRLVNLRFLCPNCHALTETFGGRNVGKTKGPAPSSPSAFTELSGAPRSKQPRFCQRCGAPITRWSKSGLCSDCVAFSARKRKRPDPQCLLEEVWQNGCAWASRKYGVVPSGIRRWLKEANLPFRKKDIKAHFPKVS